MEGPENIYLHRHSLHLPFAEMFIGLFMFNDHHDGKINHQFFFCQKKIPQT